MNTRKIGTEYESRAAEWLEDIGYEILSRNFRSSYGEIDLIARQGACLVFVEVKYRKNSSSGKPEEAVSLQKQRKISKTADRKKLIPLITMIGPTPNIPYRIPPNTGPSKFEKAIT